jgi:helicase MOV-10
MERLMELPIYQKDPATNAYNPNLITKLVRSFRSHPKIIEFSNKRFYDGDLIAKAHPELTDWALGWPFLPNQQFPVIFVPCVSETKRDEFSYSAYNDHQVAIVLNYVKQILCYGINAEKILASDIGIISPYKKQCQKIAQRLEQNEWAEVEVGTCETFQGREKPVIIISTVRSGSDKVGFLDNPKVSWAIADGIDQYLRNKNGFSTKVHINSCLKLKFGRFTRGILEISF